MGQGLYREDTGYYWPIPRFHSGFKGIKLVYPFCLFCFVFILFSSFADFMLKVNYNEQSQRMSSVDHENVQLAERVQALSAENARMRTAISEKDILIVCGLYII